MVSNCAPDHNVKRSSGVTLDETFLEMTLTSITSDEYTYIVIVQIASGLI